MKYLSRAKHFLVDYARYIYFAISNDEYKENMNRYRMCSNKKPRTQIKTELRELRNYWGCIPMQYYAHDFYSQDCNLSLDEMKTYIPGYYYYKVLHPEFDSIKQALLLCENKIIMHTMLQGLGLPTADTIFIKKSDTLLDTSGNVIDNSKLNTILSNNSSSRIFIKPIEGRGGKGIIVATKNETGYYETKGTTIDFKYLTSLNGDYIIESGLKQNEYLNKVYPNSINTLRVVTKRDKNGDTEIVAITCRMGIKGMQIDNGSAGGISIGIDKHSGKAVTEYAQYALGDERFYCHPDTGFKFSQLQIQNWDNIKKEILCFSRKLVLINLVGWDIALTDNGPIVIEVNTLSALDPMQTLLGGFRDIFVSDNPKEKLYS